MIEISKVEVFNFNGALRGMRNPHESWDKSDSYFGIIDCEGADIDYEIAELWTKTKYPDYNWLGEINSEADKLFEDYNQWLIGNGVLKSSEDFSYVEVALIGPKDMDLAQRLVLAGTDHSKFMRQIFVCFDIKAPLYLFKEFDTYKVSTVANSTSTMHKIHSREITLDDFSHEHLYNNNKEESTAFLKHLIDGLNLYRKRFVEKKDKNDWWQLIQLLPSSYNQLRTVTLNYQTLRNMYFARQHHKLDEWRDFCKFIESLPYAKELICLEE